MDIAKIKPVERVVEIVHPGTKENIGVRVTFVSINDPSMATIKRKIDDQKNKLQAKGKYFKTEEVEANVIQLLYGVITGWEFYGKDANLNGDKNPEYNLANLKIVHKEAPWFTEQIETELNDESAFFPS